MLKMKSILALGILTAALAVGCSDDDNGSKAPLSEGLIGLGEESTLDIDREDNYLFKTEGHFRTKDGKIEKRMVTFSGRLEHVQAYETGMVNTNAHRAVLKSSDPQVAKKHEVEMDCDSDNQCKTAVLMLVDKANREAAAKDIRLQLSNNRSWGFLRARTGVFTPVWEKAQTEKVRTIEEARALFTPYFSRISKAIPVGEGGSVTPDPTCVPTQRRDSLRRCTN